ncbi:alpha-1,6-mannosyl-glycoprotein 4-beta-N-acetylglucosaminyltransferase-like [Anguilla anguilla]|uniref:alpha-1,6-mannosyl-glycoprotein 4-beta-N-acetylglucosaminyltransferase-like n=1 Tax=Anguilla anguilla TaxID=7936 RepID=UPI0015B1AE2E|nr:alpha-1,6-mannosyl-glycoprotein 4-beta-N-acetylglucosaminyltransferase-like [Anguilla anguilla]
MRCPGCSRRCLAWFYRYLPVRFLFLLWLFFTGSFIFVFYTNHSRSGFRKHLVSERGTAENRTAEDRTAENGTAENGTAENGTAENGTSGVTGGANATLASPPVTCPLNRTFSYREDIASPLRIPYQILAGERPRFRKYISIGISSVRRKKENYLLGTLRSVFQQSRESDVEDMVLVVYLADWDPAAREQTAREVSDRFRGQLAARRLLLIASPRAAYPTLEGLKRNYGDSEDRVRYRSKQNADYAFLSNFCTGLARHHLVLEDDVRCARNFLLSVRRKVEASSRPWTTMAFSKLGYIGKLYHGSDLPALARFLLLFYDEMPCDWLLDHFFRSKAQGELLRVRPSLFQHVGSFSSFRGGANSLKDDEFRERAGPSGDNPPAAVSTDMEAFEGNTLEAAYEGLGFFWGRRVANGSHVSVRFREPAALRRVRVLTGSPEHSGDVLRAGLAEVGWAGARGGSLDACQTYRKIGRFVNGTLDVEGPGLGVRGPVDCLRVRVTEDQKEWLILQDLSVWIEKTGNATVKEPTK